MEPSHFSPWLAGPIIPGQSIIKTISRKMFWVVKNVNKNQCMHRKIELWYKWNAIWHCQCKMHLYMKNLGRVPHLTPKLCWGNRLSWAYLLRIPFGLLCCLSNPSLLFSLLLLCISSIIASELLSWECLCWLHFLATNWLQSWEPQHFQSIH